MNQLSAKRGIEPKRPITYDKTQSGPVPQTPGILYEARNGGFAACETVIEICSTPLANPFDFLIQNLSVLRPELCLSPHLGLSGTPTFKIHSRMYQNSNRFHIFGCMILNDKR